MDRTEIQNIFNQNGGILTTSQLTSMGVGYYTLKKLLLNHEIRRLKQGIYALGDDSQDEWYEVSKLVGQGVFCLFSAAQLHGLSTFIPSEYHVTIPRKQKVKLPDYPAIKLYYWQKKQYETGVEGIQKNGLEISVYDKEKTVCDFVKYRNKIGLDTTKEVVKNYLKGKDRNLNKLVSYSKQLRISSVIRQYVEILV